MLLCACGSQKSTVYKFYSLTVNGTNEPLDAVDSTAPGEEKLLWMRNKWMLCHPDSPQREKGAFVGISGENLDLRI